MLNYIYDPDTGEIIEIAVEHPVGFSVTDKRSANWVLEKILDSDIAINALETRKKIISNNIDRQIALHKKSKDWLIYKFEGQLLAYARHELKESKKRYIQLDYGKIGFRHCKQTVKIKDKDNAIAYLENNNLSNAVSIKKDVLLSALPAASTLPNEFFETVEAYDKFYIS